MGTRADFYVGKGQAAEWIGSIAYDGDREGVGCPVLGAAAEAHFRDAVGSLLKSVDHSTLPSQGWPWPWDNSGTSDCSYWFFDGQVWEGREGRYFPCCLDEDDSYEGETIEYPDMSSIKNVTFGRRSGLMILGF